MKEIFAFDGRTSLGAILLLFVIVWLYEPKIHIDSDQGAYSLRAHRIASWTFFERPGSHIFNHRLGLTAPVGFFYRLWGVGPITTHLWLLICGLLSIVLVWFATPKGAARPLAALLLALNPVQVKYAATLFPDIVCASFMFASCFALNKRESRWVGTSKRRSAFLALLGVWALFLGFAAKAAVYWVAPIWIGVFLVDLGRKKYNLIWRFYVPCCGWALIGIATFFISNKMIWEDYFARFEALKQVADNHLWTLPLDNRRLFVARLTTDPLIFLNRIAVPAFALSLGAFLFRKSESAFWKNYFLSVVLFWSFGSVSLNHYSPLPLYARFALPLLPPFAVLGGTFIAHIASFSSKASFGERLRLWGAFVLVGAVLFSSILTLTNPNDAEEIGLVPILVEGIALVVFTAFWKRRSQWAVYLISIVSAVVFAGTPLLFETSAPNADCGAVEEKAMKALKSALLKSDDSVYIMTGDKRSPKLLRYFFEFHYPKKLTVNAFDVERFEKLKKRKAGSVYFFINRNRTKREQRKKKGRVDIRDMKKAMRNATELEVIVKDKGVSFYRLSI